MHQMTGTDASMLLNDRPHSPNIIGGIEFYDPSTTPGGVRFKDILARLEQRSHLSTMFTHRMLEVPLGLDFPYWVRDPDFDVEYHVRHIALPKPGDWRQLAILIARLAPRPLDMTRPPWEMYVIEGLDDVDGVAPGSFAVFIKLHHAAVDGQAGNEIVNAIHDEYDPPVRADAADDDEVPSTRWLLTRAAVNALARPATAARIARSALPSRGGSSSSPPADAPPERSAAKRQSPKRPSTSTTRFNGPVTAHRVWDSRYFPLADFKRIKSAVPGATINDVSIALVGGALRDYLDRIGELPEHSLVTIMPISIRVPTGQTAIGNQISMMRVPMGTDIADPLGRLAFVQQSTAQAKQQGASASNLMQISDLMPGALPGIAARAMTSAANRAGFVAGAHTLVTNVPGPRMPLHLCGAKLTRQSGVPPVFDGMGLVHGIGSYEGEIDVIFTACRKMLPDPGVYAACIDDSVAALLAAAG